MRGDLAGGHVHHAVAGLDVRRGDEVELDAGSGYGLARLGVHLHRLYRALPVSYTHLNADASRSLMYSSGDS